jgi:hypothetical protein
MSSLGCIEAVRLLRSKGFRVYCLGLHDNLGFARMKRVLSNVSVTKEACDFRLFLRKSSVA